MKPSQPGQILPGSPFGRALTHYAGKAKRDILEVGTWNGAGSTLCLAAGMKMGVNLWTVEQDARMWGQAHKAWDSNKWVHCILGRIETVFDAGVMPRKFDLILLDGGEEQGWEDYLLLREHAPILALDDTHTPKNRRVFEDLLDEEWNILMCGKDRHGWAILRQP